VKPSVLIQLTLCAAVASAPALAIVKAAPKVHVVSSGQRLDSIATRYGVSVEQLRKANDLRPNATLKVGQRLSVPSVGRRGDAVGERADFEEKEKNSIVRAAVLSSTVAPVRHRVSPGETLSEIALRAGTTVEVLSASNKLAKGHSLRVGQVLVLPSVAKATRKSWQPYARAPKRKGYLDVSTPFSHFSGSALESDGRLRSQTVRTLNEMLGAGGSHPPLPERLIRLLIEVSDTFGGRPLRLVSGYRTASYYQDSRHKVSSAIDFLVIGVPNAVVCEYLRELEDVGVGYYPNSSFVHLDVRDHSAYWVDYAGPGEPPRSTPNAPSLPPSERPVRSADRKLLAELAGVLEQTKARLEKARSAASRASASAAKGEREPAAPTKRPVTSERAANAAFDPIAMTDDRRGMETGANGLVANLRAE
jgi:LysM repeat protein